MNPFAKRQTLAEAYRWKEARLARLWAEIEIQSSLLGSLLAEESRLEMLHGHALAARFGSETPEEIEKMTQTKEFWEVIEDLWIIGNHPTPTKQERALLQAAEEKKRKEREGRRKAQAWIPDGPQAAKVKVSEAAAA
jgi:hypothetical protein